MTTVTELRRDCSPEAEAEKMTNQSSDSDHTRQGGIHDHADGEVANRALNKAGATKLWNHRPLRTVPGGDAQRARERAEAQHVSEHAEKDTWVSTRRDSQDLDVNKASHCTGSVSSALASGDAGKRTQV